MRLRKRTQNKSLLEFRMAPSLQDETAALLDEQKITYVRKTKRILLTVDREMIEEHAQLFKSIAALVKRSTEVGS